jgi:hypothetical protein
MQAKPTLTDLANNPRHRTYASALAFKAPTRWTVGRNSAALRAKRTERELTIWARRTVKSERSYPRTAHPQLIFQRGERVRRRVVRLSVQSRLICGHEFVGFWE